MNYVSLTATALFAALSISTASAQPMGDMKSMDMGQKPAASAPMAMTHHAVGTVKKIDRNAGLVTVAHEPVKSLNWPAMTMGFQVQDKRLLDRLAVGKKVDFEFVQDTRGYVVTSVR